MVLFKGKKNSYKICSLVRESKNEKMPCYFFSSLITTEDEKVIDFGMSGINGIFVIKNEKLGNCKTVISGWYKGLNYLPRYKNVVF